MQSTECLRHQRYLLFWGTCSASLAQPIGGNPPALQCRALASAFLDITMDFQQTQHRFQVFNHDMYILVLRNGHEKAKVHDIIFSLQLLRKWLENVEL